MAEMTVNERAETLLSEIASIAHIADQQAFSDDADDHASAYALAERLRETLCKIGWIAERGALAFNPMATMIWRGGSAEQWLMPLDVFEATSRAPLEQTAA
jgi:hypothetical protein